MEAVTLDTRKRYPPSGKLRISPLRRGERDNATPTAAVRSDRRPYDLAGTTARLAWKAANDKLVGPVPMEAADTASGTVRRTLPDARCAAARAHLQASDRSPRWKLGRTRTTPRQSRPLRRELLLEQAR